MNKNVKKKDLFKVEELEPRLEMVWDDSGCGDGGNDGCGGDDGGCGGGGGGGGSEEPPIQQY